MKEEGSIVREFQNIPKVIHYCWFGDQTPSETSLHCMNTWKKVMPDYEIKLHNEANTEFDTPLLQYLYKKKSWAFISDYIRLRALYHEGGIYLDVDIEVIQSFNPLREHTIFLGYESKNRLNSSVLGSRANEPFLKACMDYMDQQFLMHKPYQIAPEVISHVSSIYEDEITVFDESYFYPYNPYDQNRDAKTLKSADITEHTYAIHHWEKQWEMGWLERIRRKLL